MAVTKEEVKNSMECRLILKGIKYSLSVLALFELIMLICIIVEADNFRAGLLQFIVVFIVVNIFMAIPLLIQFGEYRVIMGRAERYTVHEVLLENPKRSYLGRRGPKYYYIVSFTTVSGVDVTAKTRALWSDAPFAEYSRRDYDRRKIKILYDERTGKVVVLGR